MEIFSGYIVLYHGKILHLSTLLGDKGGKHGQWECRRKNYW
jgi:hypothetical protein